MDRIEKILYLNESLLEEMPEYRSDAERFPRDDGGQRRLLRSLMNVRMPGALREDLLNVQDELLREEREEKGVVHVSDLPSVPGEERIVLWQGDITRLDTDAIVNAANSRMLGCFIPCHNCIDNVIHSAAGLQLREECASLMRLQGHEEPVGQAKITAGYSLPARHVIHTVGPAVEGQLMERHCEQLRSCYCACLQKAEENGLESLAFCCISTGVFRFPKEEAAKIAVQTVLDYLAQGGKLNKIVFVVHGDENFSIYRSLLF